jgi:hypothetical protein
VTNLTFSGGTLLNLRDLGRAVAQTGGTLVRDVPGTTTINGAYALSAGTARVSAGTLTATGGITVTGTGVLTGVGRVTGAVTVGAGGAIAPGPAAGGPGLLTYDASGTMVWQPDGHFRLVYNSLTPQTDGSTNSILKGTGTLDLGGLTSSGKFVIDVTSQLESGSPAGSVSYTIASFSSGGIVNGSGNVSDRFTLSGAGYVQGTESVSVIGNDLVVSFTPVVTPVPEPAWLLLVSAAAAGCAGAARRVRPAARQAGTPA